MKAECKCCEQVLERVKSALHEVYAELRRAYILSGVGSTENAVFEVLVSAFEAAIDELNRVIDDEEVA